MNEYDSGRILDLVKPIGYSATINSSDADCYILNTCHIREKATDKVYHDIGRLKKDFRNLAWIYKENIDNYLNNSSLKGLSSNFFISTFAELPLITFIKEFNIGKFFKLIFLFFVIAIAVK